ncbi:hypothetical protein IDH44_24025 [Paenibacillus sp. IB182496]|uniref:Uncharacterized protein n=1 Tax=Paenibacillus sabuli TaxID=2772509 RepID=A0A927BZ56_9BACL|nr:hypothetical protein [Paenibacillus sabuli]MBD2848275.1 hypothetical protein [Paenibacillus sabuli]
MATSDRSVRHVKFTFFDNRLYDYIDGFTRKLGEARKHEANPLMKPELPHEYKRLHYYGSALYDEDEGVYKTWYSSHFYEKAMSEADKRAASYLNYAYSPDGVRFVRPELDKVPGTNIVLGEEDRTHGPSVIKDDADPDPSRRYKLAMAPYGGDCSIYMYASPDGFAWRQLFDGPVIKVHSDCHIGFYRDPDTGLYRISFRTRIPDRRVWIAESADLAHWSRPVLAIEPDQLDDCDVQFYGMQMTPYGAYTIGLLSMYYTYDYKTDPRYNKMAGTMDIQLAYSRDGFGWHRCMQGERLVGLGAPGEWDSLCLTPSSTVIYRPDRMVIYYTGWPVDHSGYGSLPYDEQPLECIGAAELRPDGFVLLEAGPAPAELMTRPFAVEDGELYVNAAVAADEDALVAVELCDTNGEALPGYSYADHIPLRGDGIQPVQWRGQPDPELLRRQIIRVRMRAVKAQLYAFGFPQGDDPAVYWRFKEISCLDPLRYDVAPAEEGAS